MTPNEPVRRRRKTLNDRMIAALPRKRRRYIVADPEQRGLYLRIPPEGPIAFYSVCRDVWKRQVWTRLGDHPTMLVEPARAECRAVTARLREGKPAREPVPVKPHTFRATAEDWYRRTVVAEKHRSGDEIRRCLERYVYPAWSTREFISLRRSDIVALRDVVSDKNGPRQALVVFGILSRIFGWYALRDDAYTNPIVKGMRPKVNGSRERILSDSELAAVWKAAEANGVFGGFIRWCLLTAQRRSVVLNMKWSDIDGNVWTIPRTDEREKRNAGTLELPPQAMAILERLPRLNEYVFPGRGDGPLSGISGFKAKLDARSGTSNWSIHDCRRTARSLLSRANVRPDVAERALGHSVGDAVQQTYDRHDYRAEVGHALRALASLIETIVNPPGEDKKIVRMKAKRS
jgi:integrase